MRPRRLFVYWLTHYGAKTARGDLPAAPQKLHWDLAQTVDQQFYNDLMKWSKAP